MSETVPAVSGNPKPRLAEVLRKHQRGHASFQCKGCDWEGDFGNESMDEAHADHVAAAWRDACRIETVEQLNALPVGAVVQVGNGCGLYEKDMLGKWWTDEDDAQYLLDEGDGHVTLLWLPEWQENKQ